MDGVGKVDGRGFERERDDLAVRGKHEQFGGVQVGFEAFDELLGAARAALPVHDVAYPCEARVEVVVLPALLLLIAPVRGDTVFRHVVHFEGADLYFEYLPEVGDHRGMQRLIHVALGHGDVVLYPAGHGFPLLVDLAQHLVTLLCGVDYDAHGGEIVDLVERLSGVLHLFVDGEKVLGPAEHLALYAALFEHLFELGHARVYERTALFQLLVDIGDEIFVCLGVEVFEAQILEFALHLRNTQAAGKRSVYLQRLLGYPLLTLVGEKIERTHVVQSVGQLDYYHADVVCHRHEDLAEIFYVLLFVRLVMDLVELGDAVDEGVYLVAEAGDYIVLGGGSVLDDVVKEGRGHGGRVQPEVDEYFGDGARVSEVRFARGALLVDVHLFGIVVCRKQHPPVIFGIIFGYLIQNVLHITPNRPAPLPLRGGRAPNC